MINRQSFAALFAIALSIGGLTKPAAAQSLSGVKIGNTLAQATESA